MEKTVRRYKQKPYVWTSLEYSVSSPDDDGELEVESEANEEGWYMDAPSIMYFTKEDVLLMLSQFEEEVGDGDGYSPLRHTERAEEKE